MLTRMKSLVQSTVHQSYALLTRLLAPWAAARLNKTVSEQSALQARQRERWGHVPEAKDELWIHAASVGEVHALVELIPRLLSSNEDLNLVVSTITATGAERVGAKFADHARVRHVFAPLDTGPAVRRWLDHTRPRALLLVETELWPVMLRECRRRHIPVASVNARLSERAAQRYRRFSALFTPAIRGVNPILCQTKTDAGRWRQLGAKDSQLQVTGNIKLDEPKPKAEDVEISNYRRAADRRPVWIAGSTHQGEEPMILSAHEQIVQMRPNALLILVPRHPERAPQVLRAAQTRFSAADLPASMTAKSSLVVVDQMGVLAGLYAIAGACFVGGSLVDHIGGHNLFEPARAGRVVLTGPYTADQQTAAECLAAADALIRVSDEQTLAEAVIGQLDQPMQANQAAQRARRASAQANGALERSLSALAPWLETAGFASAE